MKKVIVAATLVAVPIAGPAIALQHHQERASREQIENLGQPMPPSESAHEEPQRRSNLQPIQAPWPQQSQQESSQRPPKVQMLRMENLGQPMPPQHVRQTPTEEWPPNLRFPREGIGQPMPPQPERGTRQGQ